MNKIKFLGVELEIPESDINNFTLRWLIYEVEKEHISYKNGINVLKKLEQNYGIEITNSVLKNQLIEILNNK